MAQDKIRVLMLGWEFPPTFTGGLGPACYGLVKSLAPFTELTLVLPHSDLNFRINKVNIIGLNHFETDASKGELVLADPRVILAPDRTGGANNPPVPMRLPYRSNHVPISELASLFAETDSYGPRLMKKVTAYADIVDSISEEVQFDIIHGHDWMTYPAAVRLKRKTGKPLLVHVHSLETDRAHAEARNPVYYIEQEGLFHSDRIFPVSEYTKQTISDHYGVDPSKIFTIHNALDHEKVFRVERNDGEKWILFLGRITRQKGPEFLFETMEKLCPFLPNVKFYVCGNGDQSAELKAQVNDAGLNEQVVFTGHIPKEKVQELLAQADAYFMPSTSEPFGLSALEAAQFGIPCVISKQSGVSEVLLHVLKADCWDTDRFANYLYAAVTHRGLRETITRLTKQDRENSSWDRSAREVLKSYKYVFQTGKPESGEALPVTS